MRHDSRCVFAFLALAGALTVVAAGAAYLQDQAAHSAVRPVPRDGGAFERFELLNQRVAAQQDSRLVFIGDSITHGWEGAPQLWNECFGAYNAINLGIGGDRTQHVLWRLLNGNLEGLDPSVAVVMIGTNNSNGDDNSVAEIADGVRAIISLLKERLPNARIVLLEIFPRGEGPNPQRGKILQVNQVLRKLHDGERIHVIDIGHRFLSEDGSIPASIMPDSLHLSEEGYRIWADAISPLLRDLLEQN